MPCRRDGIWAINWNTFRLIAFSSIRSNFPLLRSAWTIYFITINEWNLRHNCVHIIYRSNDNNNMTYKLAFKLSPAVQSMSIVGLRLEHTFLHRDNQMDGVPCVKISRIACQWYFEDVVCGATTSQVFYCCSYWDAKIRIRACSHSRKAGCFLSIDVRPNTMDSFSCPPNNIFIKVQFGWLVRLCKNFIW